MNIRSIFSHTAKEPKIIFCLACRFFSKINDIEGFCSADHLVLFLNNVACKDKFKEKANDQN